MSNTNTNLTSTIVADEFLPALQLSLLPLQAMSFMAVADRPLYYGDAVRVPILTARTGGTFAGNWETGDTTTATQSVTIAKPSFASWYIDPTEETPTAERFAAMGRECAYAVGKTVLQAVLAKFVAANIGSTGDTDTKTVTVGNYDSSDLVDQWELIKGKGVQGQISAIHSVSYAAALQKDAAVKDKSASGMNTFSTGEFGSPIAGMRIFYTDAFPTAVTNENTEVIVTGPTTAAIAMGAAGDPTGLENAAGLRQEIIRDPETGLSFTYREWVNTATGFHWGAIAMMYGTAFVQNAATRVISS